MDKINDTLRNYSPPPPPPPPPSPLAMLLIKAKKHLTIRKMAAQ